MYDKYGRKLKTGDLIQFELDFMPGPLVLRVRYERANRMGWIGEKLPPNNPTPQRIGDLGHRFTILPAPAWAQ